MGDHFNEKGIKIQVGTFVKQSEVESISELLPLTVPFD